jgi:hypothetical protein
MRALKFLGAMRMRDWMRDCRNALLSVAIIACGSSSSPTVVPSGPDGSTPADASAPVDAGRDVQAANFCTGVTTDFCADFAGQTPGTGWDGVDARGGGTVTLVDATDSSKPKALRAALGPIGGANAAAAQLAKKIGLGGKKKVALDIAARFGDAAPGSDGRVLYASLRVDGGSISLFRTASGWGLGVYRKNAAGDDGAEPALQSAPPVGRWTRVRLDVVLGTTNGSVKLDVDGNTVLTQTLATHGDAQPLADVQLVLGLAHVSGSLPAMDVQYDDVTLKLDAN